MQIPAEKDEVDSEDEESKEKDAERQDVDLAPYWKVQYLEDIAYISQQNVLLDKMQTDPGTYQQVFHTVPLDRSLEQMKRMNKTLRPMSYYSNQLAYLRDLKTMPMIESENMAGLFEQLEEEPSTANTTLIEEILSTAIGLKRTGNR